MGAIWEQKLINEMRIEKEVALKIQEEYLNFLAQRRLNAAVAKVTEELTRKCEEETKLLMEVFEQRLATELEKLEAQLRAEFEETMNRKEQELKEKFKENLGVYIKKTVDVLTEEYLRRLHEKEKELEKHYELQIQ